MPSKEHNNKDKVLPPNQRAVKRLLRWGKDHPTIGGPVPKIDLKTYILTINGEVENPLKLSWEDILKLPKVESISDFHCVETWSVLNCKWEGIKFNQIMQLAKPKPNAKFVSFYCADGYSTSLSIEELSGDDILLAYKLDDNFLEDGLGAPLRLVIPSKYAYKSAMWLTQIRFTTQKELGYWEKRGYSDSADVWKNERFSRKFF
jgi:DMSO/TMAO reductase YedYZ molybdopterin-dependent catalytic subunit